MVIRIDSSVGDQHRFAEETDWFTNRSETFSNLNIVSRHRNSSRNLTLHAVSTVSSLSCCTLHAHHYNLGNSQCEGTELVVVLLIV